jgi:asparagine synthetase B (glutamine-hydrolysing)
MADLLAIISRDRSRQVSIGDLVATYESLRGAAAFSQTLSANWAEAAILDPVAPPLAGSETAGDGWTAWAGPLADPTRASAPLAELEGQFALARLAPDGGELTVATDPLGMLPLFSARADGLSYFSTSALVLAKLLRTPPSRIGVERFLRTGTMFGRYTPWEGIERLQPAEAVVFTPAGSRHETYWQPTVEAGIRSLGFDDCTAACAERGTTAFGRRYRGAHPWADLTGGFDTRLLTLITQGAGVPFHANTVGDEGHDDVDIAREIATAAGWPWTRLGLPDDWVEIAPTRIEEAVAWADGQLEALHVCNVIEGHREKAASETMLLNGGGGEQFRDYAWGHELWSANRSSEVHYDRLLAWRVLGPTDLSVFREDPTPAVAAALRSELEHRAEPFADAPNTFQCDLIHALRNTGHFGAYQALAAGWVHMELPFYLKSVFSAAISAHPRHRQLHRLMRAMDRLLDPRVAAIRTKTGGPAEPIRAANLYRFTPYLWRRSKRFGSRLRGRVMGDGSKGDGVTVTERERAFAATVAALRAQGRLDPARMRSAALYEPAALEALLARAEGAAVGVDWSLVGRAVTVELALAAADAAIE